MRLATLLACLLAVPAAAQAPGTYAVFATQAELDDGGTLSGAVPTCLLAGTASGVSGAFFWDATSEQFAIYDASADPGSRTSVPVPGFLIDIAAGTDVETCRDATPELGPNGVPTGVAFLVLSNSNDEDFVARVDAASQGFSVLTDRGNATDAGDGISGIAQIGDVLYLARQRAFGAPEDGIYTIDTTTEDQVPASFLIDPNLDLTSLAYADASVADADPGLYVVSSEFGQGAFKNVLLFLDPTATTPALLLAAAPCTGAAPVFADCEDGGLEDVAIGSLQFSGDLGYTQVLVSNNSFSAATGELVASFLLLENVLIGASEDREPEVAFSETDLVAQTGVSGFATPEASGYLAFTDPGPAGAPALFLASSAESGAEAGIYSVVPPFLVSNETALESAFELSVMPNPTGGAARLTVTPETSGALRLSVVDALGRTVAVLHDGVAAAGNALELWTPELAPGVYSVRVEGMAGTAGRQLTVVR